MGKIQVEQRQAHLSGALTFASVTSLMDQGRQLIADNVIDSINMANVTHSDSAGLALLVDWLRLAHSYQRSLTFTDVPAQIVTFARISEIDELLFGKFR